jgi:hypothetical protein
MSWPWSQLGLPGPSDLPEIRHAYAEKLKTTHPEEDPEGFQSLHAAYQAASRMARQRKRRERPAQPEPVRPPETPPEPEPPREEFDFGQLLEDGEEDPRPPQNGEEQTFDFDRLLQSDEAPPPPPREEAQDFDFERLFAEGEAERAEARRRRAEQRRRAQAQVRAWARERQRAQEWTQKQEYWQRQERQNNYDRERREQFSQEEARWQSTETILHTLEMLHNAQAPLGEWEKFFASPLFRRSKGELDLIFGLEDFVSARDLPREVRLALFLAYGFDKGVAMPQLHPLYQMLLPAWGAEKQEKGQQRLYKLGVCIAGVLLTPLALVLFGAGGLLGIALLVAASSVALIGMAFRRGPNGKRNLLLLWLLLFFTFTYVCYDRGLGLTIPLGILGVGFVCWVLWQVVKLGTTEKRARGRTVTRKEELRAMLGFVLAAALLLVLSWLRTEPDLGQLLPAKDPREQVCAYMEEDFGIPFQSIYNKTKLERHNNVFAPEDSVGDMFLAGPDGERNDGNAGYTTNYPEMRMLWALKDFAKDHDIPRVDSMDRELELEQWETSGTILITLPFYGAGDTISALGDLLEELSRERWYQAWTPECEIVLCGRPMKEGRLVLTRYQPADGDFDTSGVRTLYEGSFAHTYCAKLLEELELDRDFIRDGTTPYTLTDGGMAELKGETCFRLYGLDETGAVALEYYVNLNGDNIYCVPGSFWAEGNDEEQIGFYRLLHREENLGLVSLFYPWIKVN